MTKQRRGDLDFLRVAAIIAVIVIHCIAIVVTRREPGSAAQTVGVIIDSFVRWCVPVFIMISGALVIQPRTFADGEMVPYLKKRLSRIALPILAWPLLYTLWATTIMHASFQPQRLFKEYLMGSFSVGYHLYFLFVIAGLYLLTPIINVCIAHLSRRQLWRITIMILATSALWWGVEVILKHPGSVNAISSSLPFLGYFLLGYLIRDSRPKQPAIPVTFFILGSSLIASLTYISSQHGSLYFYDYQSVTVLFVSPMAFLTGRYIYDTVSSALSSSWSARFDGILVTLSAASFGVYLIHVMILRTFASAFHLSTVSLKVALLLMPVTAILSWSATLLLLRVPYLNKLVR